MLQLLEGEGLPVLGALSMNFNDPLYASKTKEMTTRHRLQHQRTFPPFISAIPQPVLQVPVTCSMHL